MQTGERVWENLNVSCEPEKCLAEKLETTNYTSINIKSWCSADIEIKVKGRPFVRIFYLSDKERTSKR